MESLYLSTLFNLTTEATEQPRLGFAASSSSSLFHDNEASSSSSSEDLFRPASLHQRVTPKLSKKWRRMNLDAAMISKAVAMAKELEESGTALSSCSSSSTLDWVLESMLPRARPTTSRLRPSF